ncbi:MAG: hypothetical protein E7617_01195 [Ruminococcaceae bacterium]|nr:hypothetical protein [Oscillospiraceae bacterium]
MKTSNEDFIPVILGGDLNGYSMAMSFAARYGVVSHVFARDRLAITDSSAFVRLHTVKALDECDAAVPALMKFADEHKGQRLLLIPCADWYIEMLEYARDALNGRFFFHIPSFEVWRATSDKSVFIEIMDRYGIPHPKGEAFRSDLHDFQRRCSYLRPPFVVKAADSDEFWRNSFPGMEKVYFADSLDEVRNIGKIIFGSGYQGKLIVQEYVGNNNGAHPPYSSVLTTYSDSRGRVIRAVLGDVILEELSPTARGNYSAILTRRPDDITQKIISMLDGIGYTGIANFDILIADGRSYCLELNPRQGRSFDYVRSAGMDVAELLVNEMNGVSTGESFLYEDGFWRCVSRRTVIKYANNKGLLNKALELEKRGRAITPYDRGGDSGILRRLYVMTHLLREGRRYSRYAKEAARCY